MPVLLSRRAWSRGSGSRLPAPIFVSVTLDWRYFISPCLSFPIYKMELSGSFRGAHTKALVTGPSCSQHSAFHSCCYRSASTAPATVNQAYEMPGCCLAQNERRPGKRHHDVYCLVWGLLSPTISCPRPAPGAGSDSCSFASWLGGLRSPLYSHLERGCDNVCLLSCWEGRMGKCREMPGL